MTDKEKKSKIADILMDFQEEYSNEVVNRPMLASLYAGNILSFIDSMQKEPVNHNKLNIMLDEALSKETAETWNKKLNEEPVSKDLEEVMQHNAPDNIGIDDLLYWRNGFITGAKWRKEQIEEVLLSEILPCFMYGGEADGVVAKLDEVLNQKK